MNHLKTRISFFVFIVGGLFLLYVFGVFFALSVPVLMVFFIILSNIFRDRDVKAKNNR